MMLRRTSETPSDPFYEGLELLSETNAIDNLVASLLQAQINDHLKSPSRLRGLPDENVCISRCADIMSNFCVRVVIRGGGINVDRRQQLMTAIMGTYTRTQWGSASIGCGAAVLSRLGFPTFDPRHSSPPECPRVRSAARRLFEAMEMTTLDELLPAFPLQADEQDEDDYVLDVPLILNFGHMACLNFCIGTQFMRGTEISFRWPDIVQKAVANNEVTLRIGWHMAYWLFGKLRTTLASSSLYGSSLQFSTQSSYVIVGESYIDIIPCRKSGYKVCITLDGLETEPPVIEYIEVLDFDGARYAVLEVTRVTPVLALPFHAMYECFVTDTPVDNFRFVFDCPTREVVEIKVALLSRCKTTCEHGLYGIQIADEGGDFWDIEWKPTNIDHLTNTNGTP